MEKPAQMEKIELHLNILQRIAFSLLKLAYGTQRIFSWFFWKIFGSWLLPIFFQFWGIKNDSVDNNLKSIHFYYDEISYYGGQYIKIIARFNSWISGKKSNISSYSFLLKWNPSIPLIAIKAKNEKYFLQWLGAGFTPIDSPNKGYPIEGSAFLGSSQLQGYFKILEKTLNEQQQYVQIKCVWLSGDEKGKIFEITPDLDLRNIGKPDTIYFPPHCIVWLFEAIVSISMVSLLVGALYQAFIHLGGKELLRYGWKFVTDIFSSLV